MDLSIIVPFCNEAPFAGFTTQSLIEELYGFCEFEVILVDNMSHKTLTTKAGDREYPTFSRNYFYSEEKQRAMDTWFFRQGIVKHFIYDEKQGHWNAKNHGIKNSTGKYVLFWDAHCIVGRDSIRNMLTWLKENDGKIMYERMGVPWRVGAVHAYINYMLDSRSLEYRVERKTFGYKFCTHQSEVYYDEQGRAKLRWPTAPYQVCVMSTCGMMTPRHVLDELGAWHPEFGIYGGGESYMNWKQAVCGYGQWIHPKAKCWHFADKRGYCWNHTDFVRNSFIAAYIVGGERFLDEQAEMRRVKENPAHIDKLCFDVIDKCKEEREFIASKQMIDFEDYISYWEKNPGTWRL